MLCGVGLKADKKTRERVLDHAIVFVSSDQVPFMRKLLKQRVSKRDNPLYNSMCA